MRATACSSCWVVARCSADAATVSAPAIGIRYWVGDLVGVDVGLGLGFTGGTAEDSAGLSNPIDNAFGSVDHHLARLEEVGHGRKETRTATVVSAKGLAEHHEFPGLKAFGRIDSRRETDAKVQTETRYFALSWMPEPEALLATVRAHWSIENALHWQLDVSFREDAARNRKDHGTANIAILRRRALDIARRDTSKGSLSIKLKRAGWSDAFLLSLLNQLVTS